MSTVPGTVCVVSDEGRPEDGSYSPCLFVQTAKSKYQSLLQPLVWLCSVWDGEQHSVMSVCTGCDGDIWSFAHFNVWLREKTGEVKASKLVQFAQRAPASAFWLWEMLVCPEAAPSLGFSEAVYPEGCSARTPGPRLDGGEWRPGSDGPEPWLLPPTSPGREERQPGGGHQDRWRAESIPWVDGSPGRRRNRCYPPNCLCTPPLKWCWWRNKHR